MEIFDLDANSFADEFTYTVKNLKGEDTSLQVTFAGPGHSQTLAAEEAALRKSVADNSVWLKEAQELVKQGKSAPAKALTVSEYRKQEADKVAARILRSSELRYAGEVITLTPANAGAILASPAVYDWLTSQLVSAVENKGNFMPSCA